MTGVSILSTNVGNIASIDVQVIGMTSNVGYHTIYITGTDDGAPPLTNSTPVIVVVNPVPTTNFTFLPAMPISPGTTVTFTNTSVGAFSYSWDFGDGSPPWPLANPTHTYNTAGTYTVTLTATAPNGCSSSNQQQIIVAACSTADFTVIDTLCQGSQAQITFTGAAGAGAIFNWSFGTGTIISGTSRGLFCNLGSPGNETITLSVDDNPCAVVNTSKPVHVVAIPNASILTSPSVCVGDQTTLAFNGTALPSASLTWNIGTATIVAGNGSIANPYTLLWNTSGPTNLVLIVNQNGCIDTVQSAVNVYQVPTSSFSLAPAVCAYSNLQINYNGSATTNAIYTWDFAGGTVHSGSGQGLIQ